MSCNGGGNGDDPPPPNNGRAPPPPDDDDGFGTNLFLFLVALAASVVTLMYGERISAVSDVDLDYSANQIQYKCPIMPYELVSKSVCGPQSAEDLLALSGNRRRKVCPLLRQLEYSEVKCTDFIGFDLALCGNGGIVVSTPDTLSYPDKCPDTALKQAANILNKEMTPGNSWSFCGSGKVMIKTIMPAIIIGFAIHHPENNTIPDGYAVSAPKSFEVYGFREEYQEFFFGRYKFSLLGRGSQYFAVRFFSPMEFDHILFYFENNHGNPFYTAVYRVSIFGETGTPWFTEDER